MSVGMPCPLLVSSCVRFVSSCAKSQDLQDLVAVVEPAETNQLRLVYLGA